MQLLSIIAGSLFLLAQEGMSTPVADASKVSQFSLVPKVTKGPSKFDGGFITGFHIGAAQNAAIQVPHHGPKFFLNGTSLQQADTGDIPYTLGVQDVKLYKSTAPKSYRYINLDAGFSKGFSINKKGVVQYSGKQPLDTFVICHVNGIAPYFSVGPQNQLLWRPKGAKASYKHCADVVLTAKYH